MTNKPSRVFETEEFTQFSAEVHTLLQAETTSLSEYELLNKLKDSSDFDFVNIVFTDRSSLFYSHFILFHCLYRLRVSLLAQEVAIMEISALKIQMHPYSSKKHNRNLTQTDPLQEYYLDTNNLDNTDETDLDDMIDNFWHKLIAQDARPQALAILGLKDPVDDALIKKTWRKLVMQHHPDRGGDAKTLLSINKAFSILIV